MFTIYCLYKGDKHSTYKQITTPSRIMVKRIIHKVFILK